MKDVPNSDLFYSDLLVSGVHSTFKIVFPFYFIAVQPGFSVLLQHLSYLNAYLLYLCWADVYITD